MLSSYESVCFLTEYRYVAYVVWKLTVNKHRWPFLPAYKYCSSKSKLILLQIPYHQIQLYKLCTQCISAESRTSFELQCEDQDYSSTFFECLFCASLLPIEHHLENVTCSVIFSTSAFLACGFKSQLRLEFSGFSMWHFLKLIVRSFLRVFQFPLLLHWLMVSVNKIKLK